MRLRGLCRELPEPCANSTTPRAPSGTVTSAASSAPAAWIRTAVPASTVSPPQVGLCSGLARGPVRRLVHLAHQRVGREDVVLQLRYVAHRVVRLLDPIGELTRLPHILEVERFAHLVSSP